MIVGSPGIKLGRYFGVPLTLEFFHLFIPVMLAIAWILPSAKAIGITDTLPIVAFTIVTIILMELSLLIHEFAHVRAGQLIGYDTKEVRMILFGAVAMMAGTGQKALDALFIAAAGPAASLVLWAVFYYAVSIFIPDTDAYLWVHVMAYLVAYFNLVLALFNLIPAFPTDGGRILVSLCWLVTKNFVKSMKIGAVVGIIAAAYGVYFGWIHSGYMLIFISVMVLLINYKTLRSSYAEILVMKGAKTLQ